MSTLPPNFNEKVIAEFRANAGVVGGPFEGAPMILVHNTGARSGTEYVTPLVYLPHDEDYVIFASKGGAPQNPSWYHNLTAVSETTVELGAETVPVAVREVTGEERDRLYAAQAERMPNFAEYEKATDRVIPVIVLTPSGS